MICSSPIRFLLQGALHLALPPACVACSRPLARAGRVALCEACRETLPHQVGPRCDVCDMPCSEEDGETCQHHDGWGVSRARAAFQYGGVVADLVSMGKFDGREEAIAVLGELLAQHQEARALAFDAECLVPVPLARSRQRTRGFNQSALLSRLLRRRWGLPVSHCLMRSGGQVPQSTLPWEARWRNADGSFVTRGRVPARVLLVDDVLTSGATVSHAAQVLRAAGAHEVAAVAIARAV